VVEKKTPDPSAAVPIVSETSRAAVPGEIRRVAPPTRS
jgi:hypothetical protein